VFEESLILQPILHRKPVRGDLLDGKLQLKHASAAKRSDMNNKKH